MKTFPVEETGADVLPFPTESQPGAYEAWDRVWRLFYALHAIERCRSIIADDSSEREACAGLSAAAELLAELGERLAAEAKAATTT